MQDFLRELVTAIWRSLKRAYIGSNTPKDPSVFIDIKIVKKPVKRLPKRRV